MSDTIAAAIRIDGHEVDLNLAPADLRRRWERAQAGLELAQAQNQQHVADALKVELIEIGREILAASAAHVMLRAAPRCSGANNVGEALRRRAGVDTPDELRKGQGLVEALGKPRPGSGRARALTEKLRQSRNRNI